MNVKTVTVIGANGTMGSNVSAIFASFGNAKVYMVCRDKDSAIKAKERACMSVKAESMKENMLLASYSELGQIIPESDIVFESAAEDWEVKVSVTKQAAKAADTSRNQHTIFCTGSSGLPITGLAELYPEELRGNYIGMHMFNPPYQMTLCEIIPTRYTDREMLKEVKEYCAKVLYRTVVEVKDSPAFLGNRIGFRFMNETLQYAEAYKDSGGIDYIDSILGSFTGRAVPPLRTANFVGLDVHKAIVDNLYQNTHDYAHDDFVLPGYVEKLIAKGALGVKAGYGLYRTVVHESGVKIYQVYDIASDSYRDVMKYTFPFAEKMIHHIRQGEYRQAFLTLIKNHSIEAELCVKVLLKYILYSLSAGEEVGYDIHSADDVMAAGFHWCPPLAMAEALSAVEDIQKLCSERLYNGKFIKNRDRALLEKLERSKYDYRRYMKAKQ